MKGIIIININMINKEKSRDDWLPIKYFMTNGQSMHCDSLVQKLFFTWLLLKEKKKVGIASWLFS